MLKKVATQADFVAIENKILDFWKENRSFEKTDPHGGAQNPAKNPA